MKTPAICIALLLCAAAAVPSGHAAVESEASAPQAVSLSIYDQGFALISEVRRLTPAVGENTIRFRNLPASVDPRSVSFLPVAGVAGLTVLEQQYHFDSLDTTSLLRRYLNQPITVTVAGTPHTGRLLHVPAWHDGAAAHEPLVLSGDGAAGRVLAQPDLIEQIELPDIEARAFLQPTLVWRAEAASGEPQNIRLTYRADQLFWSAAYDVVLDASAQQAFFALRMALDNRSGSRFEQARVELITTERGMLAQERRSAVTQAGRRGAARPGDPMMRYAYGTREPAFAEATASLTPLHSYALDAPVDLPAASEVFVQTLQVEALPVTRFYVYDGVQFDRFPRNLRTDWEFGTESSASVETHLQFENIEAMGLGQPLPAGAFRLYQQAADGSVSLLGEDQLLPVLPGETARLLLGPARGLRGERQRTSYTEVTPLRVYEESFQIQLWNDTDEPAEIRVVEHLYRWPEYEIVRADAEYEETMEQVIEFRPVLQPKGRRTITYTVRYSW